MTKLIRFDWALKTLLRHKANFDILEGFLSELLKVSIKIDRILESESNKGHSEDKSNRVDLLVRTAEDEHIIIEVQCSSQWDYFSRVLYGTSKVITEHIAQGEPYGSIRKVISVSVVFFNLGVGKDYLYKGSTTFRGIHCDDILKLAPKDLEMYTKNALSPNRQTLEDIFPEYYLIKVSQFKERISDKLDEWIYFLKNGQIKNNFNAQGLQSAAAKLDVLRLSEEERWAYQRYQEHLRDEASYAFELKMAEEKGEVKGEAKGEAKGIVIGEARGKIRGVSEVAINMFKQSYSLESISSVTGLSIIEVKLLIKEHAVQKTETET
jgi:predicted transposase/invertase (TIGR01784 family)